MGVLGRPDRAREHRWSQRHLSHYVEGDLRPRARRRLDRHARDCAECGRGRRAMRALVQAARELDGPAARPPSAALFDRARQAQAAPPAR
jgi:putative zinc finger protein